MTSPSEGTAHQAREEAAGASVLYEYFARLFLDPIKVPGTSCVIDLHERTSRLFADVATEEDEGVRSMASWVSKIGALRKRAVDDHAAQALLEEEQRLLAADRTQLCRGTQAAGPLPPYEEYYAGNTSASETAVPTLSAAAAAYHQAGVHFDEQRKERDDYAGTELAFLACLAQRELAALDQEDFAAANKVRGEREAFEREHLPWLRAYAKAALPHARTEFWQGALGILERVAE